MVRCDNWKQLPSLIWKASIELKIQMWRHCKCSASIRRCGHGNLKIQLLILHHKDISILAEQFDGWIWQSRQGSGDERTKTREWLEINFNVKSRTVSGQLDTQTNCDSQSTMWQFSLVWMPWLSMLTWLALIIIVRLAFKGDSIHFRVDVCFIQMSNILIIIGHDNLNDDPGQISSNDMMTWFLTTRTFLRFNYV